MEPITALTTVGNAAKEAANSTLVQKLLGPTAEYLGQYMKETVERRVTNTNRIFRVAERRLGSRINNEGSVHPKVLKEILDEGSYADDELAAEYFGGILASSRSGVSRDDRGAYFCSLVARLTTYQLRTHYLVYRFFKAEYENETFRLADPEQTMRVACFVPLESYIHAMDLAEGENITLIMQNAFFGLHNADLVDTFQYGNAPKMLTAKTSLGPGIVVEPSIQGAELFLWAHGHSDVVASNFFHPSIAIAADLDIPAMASAYVTDTARENEKAVQLQAKALQKE